MKLKTIGVLLLIAALIGGSVGVIAAQDDGVNNGHPCEDCTWDGGRDWQNHDEDDDQGRSPDKVHEHIGK